MARSPDLQTLVPVEVDLASVLAPLRVGVGDPCWRVEPSGAWWWATRTPAGPVTVRLQAGDEGVDVQGWGEGTAWLPPRLPRLVGAVDPGLDGASPLVTELAARYPGFRLAGHGRVADAAIQAMCRRGVSAFEASRSWTFMVEILGDDAPGPGGLRLPPAPRRLATCDPYELHIWGLEHTRADAIRRIATHAGRLEPAADDEGGPRAVDHLAGITGIGGDVVAHARSVALGDPDALPVLDVHQSAAVIRALWSDAEHDREGGAVDLPALLTPHAPHRGRLVRLVALADAARAEEA